MEEKERFNALMERAQKASDLKIRLEERFNAEKTRLEKLLKEISEKGFDPKKLSEIRQEKEAEAKKMLEEFETQLKNVEEQLSAIEEAYNEIQG